MSWVGVAIGGSALIGAGAGVYSANKAAGAQQEAGQQSLAFQQQVFAEKQRQQIENARIYGEQRQAYDQQTGLLRPTVEAGAGAMDKLRTLYGLGGSGSGGDWASFLRGSPEYQFSLSEGTNALQNSAAAKGGLLSGNFARGITEFGQGLASKQIGNYISNLQNIGQLGASTGISLGGQRASLAGASGGLVGQGSMLSGQMAGQIGGTIGGIGQAQASGYVGGANAVTGSLGSGVQNYLLMNALANKSSYAPSGYYGGSPATNSNLMPT